LDFINNPPRFYCFSFVSHFYFPTCSGVSFHAVSKLHFVWSQHRKMANSNILLFNFRLYFDSGRLIEWIIF